MVDLQPTTLKRQNLVIIHVKPANLFFVILDLLMQFLKATGHLSLIHEVLHCHCSHVMDPTNYRLAYGKNKELVNNVALVTQHK